MLPLRWVREKPQSLPSGASVRGTKVEAAKRPEKGSVRSLSSPTPKAERKEHMLCQNGNRESGTGNGYHQCANEAWGTGNAA